MTRKSYTEKLEGLRKDVLEMGYLVHERLNQALDAMITVDKERADSIGSGDDQIDDTYVEIEGECSDLLALQQPVATDLRLITASFKIITDLERIGDKVVNLTDYTKLFKEKRIMDEEDIKKLGNFAADMLENALEYYENQDLERARKLVERDDEMDNMCEESTNKILGHLIEKESKTLSTEEATQLGQQVSTELLTIRDLERVADHATNIAARTIYLVSSTRELI
ncbi:phosphate signaling complex protein PhoU [Candidatus Bipolaricaulota bacterium]|nr:phosphate signaling complex protein PhoU [Candidatus Bipolaricaulota bacterium]MBS3825428.1 phosphate signaling complex protein PhoU [Candidatus Bipolaricaulota bacterium]